MSQFYKFVKNEAKESELVLEGVIASESWYDDEVSPKMFRDELNKHSGDLTVRINSPGGDVFAGVSIYNALTEYDGNVTVKIDGLAASIASLIAMAGDKIVMLPGSMMMVHQPWTIAMGNSDEIAQVVEMLEKTCESMVPIYTARTGQSAEKINELLKAETWLTAADAVGLGFADEAVEAKSNLSEAINAALNYAQTVNNAVMQPAMSLKSRKVSNVTDTTEAPAKDGIQATEATGKTETTEIVESAAEETIKSTHKDKEMAETAEIAKGQVLEPKDQAKVETKAKPSNYLKSKASLEDFAGVLQANAGRSAEEVKNAWKGVLVKNGLSDPTFFALPEPLVTSIEDAVKASGIYSLLNHTGLDVFRVVWDDTDAELDTSRAGGHKKGDTKTEQILGFNDRVIRAQYIYKYLTLNKEDIRENRSSGALMRFVLNELPARVIREVERAVVIGDGRAATANRKITSFESIRADVVAGNSFASSYLPVVGESRAESVARATDLILAEGEVTLIAKKGFATDARFEKGGDGKLLFPLGSSANDILGVSRLIEPTWFTDATDATYDAYLVVLGAYNTVGDNSIESFTNFTLATNKNEFLQEIYKGGALAARKAAVGIGASLNS